MAEIDVYILILIITVIIINSNFSLNLIPKQEDNLLFIEYLAQFSSKQRNYRKSVENYQSFGYFVNGEIKDGYGMVTYKFPLIEKKESTFWLKFDPKIFSDTLSKFGVSRSFFSEINSKGYHISESDETLLKEQLNNNGFYFNNNGDWGLDYKYLLSISAEINTSIARFLANELYKNNLDSYVNRIIAALNFVQFIPYGVPDFDDKHVYFGLALPQESVAISFSDCDSKSTLLVGILKNLIDVENIILVTCIYDGGPHMILGISDLPFEGPSVNYKGKNYFLVETTTPIPLDQHDTLSKYSNLKIIPIS
jgi:hypothetical protein